jgi:hypothetical protein
MISNVRARGQDHALWHLGGIAICRRMWDTAMRECFRGQAAISGLRWRLSRHRRMRSCIVPREAPITIAKSSALKSPPAHNQRTAPLGLTARIFLGGASGLALATSGGISVPFSVLLASSGALAGAFVGYHTVVYWSPKLMCQISTSRSQKTRLQLRADCYSPLRGLTIADF